LDVDYSAVGKDLHLRRTPNATASAAIIIITTIIATATATAAAAASHLLLLLLLCGECYYHRGIHRHLQCDSEFSMVGAVW
jgi:hypothetical protein